MTELLRELREIIAAEGPISLGRYMGLALSHPRYGYYTTREPFGVAGDFVTAPEISQMFGELIGLWAAEVWKLGGAPAPMRLVELGPGRGTLMADALRAIRKVPEVVGRIEVHLVETSPRLIEIQRARLAQYDAPIEWHGGPADIPSGPAILIANEFFDALPVQHFVRTEKGWCERLVRLDAHGKLAFGLSPLSAREIGVTAPEGSIIEISPKAREIVSALAGRIAGNGGALLLIDYGYADTQAGETLQGVRNHGFVDPLEAPGECDLTAHVDFAALAREAKAADARVHGPATQAEFLLALGIVARAQILKRNATAAQAAAIDTAVSRLTDCSTPTSMGQLFKVMAITPRDMPALPGFAS
ncbi:MAG: dehydrogenase [ubiquinone] 1 alpha subcomplex assembly factor 7 [Methylobacteriaceae bacterium]|nr:dehydrogenase [ubiquinone] 1 alpha subcomplex assembly factor 7 [Methylobacteriaceae bacterium]